MSVRKRVLAGKLVFLGCLSSVAPALAAPTITNVNGTFSNGQQVTLAGSGFGSTTPSPEFIGPAIEGGTAGQDFSRTGWSNNWGWQNLKYSTDTPHSGKQCLKAITNPNDGALEAILSYQLPSSVLPGQEIFLSWWVKVATGVPTGQWKMLRLSDTSTIVDGLSQMVMFNWDNNSGNNQLVATPLTDQGRYPGTVYPSWDGTWYRMDLDAKASAAGVANGTVTITRYHPGAPLASNVQSSYMTDKDSSYYWNYAIFQNYFGNGQTSGTVWMDDIYVQKGTQARVELCDSPTWAGRTQCEIQAPSSWSDSSATINVNTGGLSGSGYLYVVDGSGNASNGVPVSFGASSGSSTDTTPPTVSISSPVGGASVSGTTTISATASDNVGVSKVQLYLDSTSTTPVATDTASPYTFSWNSAGVANGSHTLYAKAYDAAGNSSQSSVTVTVNNSVADTTPPTVSISAPASGASVSGNAVVTAQASDNVAVSKVEFYVDSTSSTPAATATAAPYTFTWNTTTVANGAHTLYTKAYDAAGNVGQSSGPVTVSNATVAPGTYTATFGNGSGTTYPNTVQDTFIDINTNVNSTSTLLSAYTWPANTPANAIIMKWNLSALPANAQIQSATLSLYMNYMEGTGGDALYQIPVSKIINKSPVIASCNGYTYDGTNAWDPSSVASNSTPLAQANIAPPVDAPNIDMTYGYKSWNVTSIVKDWVANPSSNYGLLLDGSKSATADSNRGFGSSRATDPTQRPTLTVTYTVGVGAPQNLKIVAQTQP